MARSRRVACFQRGFSCCRHDSNAPLLTGGGFRRAPIYSGSRLRVFPFSADPKSHHRDGYCFRRARRIVLFHINRESSTKGAEVRTPALRMLGRDFPAIAAWNFVTFRPAMRCCLATAKSPLRLVRWRCFVNMRFERRTKNRSFRTADHRFSS